MDSPTRDPPKRKSFTSFLFFGKRRETPEKKPPLHLHTSASLHLEPGLKTLTSPFNPNRSLTCFKPTHLSFPPSPTSTSSCPSPSSSQMDREKETDKNDNNNAVSEEEEEEGTNTHETPERICQRIYPHQLSHRRRRRRSSKEREFPPPIPLLARTGNLPCHMPWVLRRIRDNGRLVIQEVLVKHHEFFRTHRANGRLTLQLMHLDESVLFNLLPPTTPLHLHLEDEKKDPTPDDVNEEQEKEKEDHEEQVSSIPKDSQEKHHPSSSATASSKEKSIKENNPSSEPLHQSLSLPSLSDGNLNTQRAILDNGPLVPLQEKNVPDVSSQKGSLPCILSSSLPESSLGIGGNGGGSCFASGRSNTLFQMPAPTIRPIHG